MFRRLVWYVKYYNEPDSKLVRSLAHQSSIQYFKGKFCPTIDEQIAYQKSYNNTFRHNYAKTKLESM